MRMVTIKTQNNESITITEHQATVLKRMLDWAYDVDDPNSIDFRTKKDHINLRFFDDGE